MTIPVVFSSDDTYIPYMASTIESIMRNANKQNHYIVIILYINISEENKLLLEKQIKTYANFSIQFRNVASYIEGYTFHIDGLCIETYFRLLIPYILDEYQKVMYLDGDIICCDDIACIYNYDLGNNLIGAIRGLAEISYYYQSKARERHDHFTVAAGNKNQDNYFNAGVLLFNTKEFRKIFSMNELLNMAASRQWPTRDQGLLNYICENRVYFLPSNWNVIPDPCLKNAPDWIKTEHIRAKADVKIIHFYLKPWKCANYIPYSFDFWKYAVNTPFINIITERMERNGLIGDYYKKDIDRMSLKQIGFIMTKRLMRTLIGKNCYGAVRHIIKALIKRVKTRRNESPWIKQRSQA
ncbi:MAG: glycosyltransferase family 8 protein [Treponema sp.]|jgi:lipopolysaccharide biosynthesis glycosyltransferase|nr:glycosyltransferase family 8 protein [Treponema sp.]